MSVKTAHGFGVRMNLSDEDRIALKEELAGRVEEFYNGCHGKSNGRFCKGKTAISEGIQEKVNTTKETLEGRKGSENIKSVTTGFGRNVGAVRLGKLAKSNLKTFSTSDLKTIKKQLKVDQTHFKIVKNIGIATAVLNIATGLEPTPFKVIRLANSATMIGIANYKTNHIPEHLTRVNKELRSRGELSAVDVITFAAEITVQQEIDKALKELKSGNVPKITTRPTSTQVAELSKYLDALEPDSDEGITKKMITDMKSALADYQKPIK